MALMSSNQAAESTVNVYRGVKGEASQTHLRYSSKSPRSPQEAAKVRGHSLKLGGGKVWHFCCPHRNEGLCRSVMGSEEPVMLPGQAVCRAGSGQAK